MNDYELVTIISPEVDEDGLSKIIDKVDQSISNRGGVVDGTDKWGRRKLAYPVKKFMEADYILTRFKMQSSSIQDLESEISALGDVLRYLVVRTKG